MQVINQFILKCRPVGTNIWGFQNFQSNCDDSLMIYDIAWTAFPLFYFPGYFMDHAVNLKDLPVR